MISEKIQENIERLPDYLQVEVSDFVEYLLIKYHIQTESTNIPEKHKQILQERHDRMQDNRGNTERWDVVKNELMQKYAL